MGRMFDEKRLNERLTIIKNNLRHLAATRCVDVNGDGVLTAQEFLSNDRAIDGAIFGALDAYDEELGAMYRQYADAIGARGAVPAGRRQK